MLAFPLHMAIMSDPAFPYPAIGMVHVENTITAHRAVRVGEALDVTTSVGAPRPHAKGVLLDFVTTVSADDGTAWESTSTYLRRGRTIEGEPSPGLAIVDAPTGGVEWRLPANLGRTYAAVSGDANPIHLYPLTAKALGFPRQIAHGMWTKARSVAAIENRLPDAVTVEVAFKKPVFLPGTVAFAARQGEGSWTFAMTSPKDGSPHLLGRTTPA
jgi:acyl dehydratase